MISARVQVRPEYEKPLRAVLPLDDHDRMMTFSGGEEVGRNPRKVVRRIVCGAEGDGGVYYLKQAWHRGALDWMRAAMRSRGVRIVTDRERHMLALHRKAGIPVMQEVAWGRKALAGVPLSGFLVVQGVEGVDFAEAYHRIGERERRDLMGAYGALVGSMHTRGLDALARTTDVFCVSDRYDDFTRAFVLIDREWGALTLVPMPLKRRCNRLATLFVKTRRWLGIPSGKEMLSFLEAYLGASPGLSMSADALYREVSVDLAGREKDPCGGAHTRRRNGRERRQAVKDPARQKGDRP